MRAVLIGSVSSSAAALAGLQRGGLSVAAVCGLSQQHSIGVSDYRDLEPLAAASRTPFIGFKKVIEPPVVDLLKQVRPDWLFVIGLSQLVPHEMRQLASRGAIGFHPTPLPRGRGRAPVAWTILLDQPAAASLFFLTDTADAGDIIAQRPVPVLPDDYASDLIDRTNVALEELTAELCPSFVSGNVPRRPQNEEEATIYERRRPEDGLIEWTQPAEQVYRLIRAVSHPYPGAFSWYQGQKIVIWKGRPIEGKMTARPGTIIEVQDQLPVVQTGDGCILCTEVESDQSWRVREFFDRL